MAPWPGAQGTPGAGLSSQVTIQQRTPAVLITSRVQDPGADHACQHHHYVSSSSLYQRACPPSLCLEIWIWPIVTVGQPESGTLRRTAARAGLKWRETLKLHSAKASGSALLTAARMSSSLNILILNGCDGPVTVIWDVVCLVKWSPRLSSGDVCVIMSQTWPSQHLSGKIGYRTLSLGRKIGSLQNLMKRLSCHSKLII